MATKLDPDVKEMTKGERGQEIMRLRNAFRKELNCTGNRRCWVNLLKPLPGGRSIKPLSLPRAEFLGNCARYYDRNQKPLPGEREKRKLLAEGRKLAQQVEREMRPLFDLSKAPNVRFRSARVKKKKPRRR